MYQFQRPSNNGAYHIINVERNGEMLIVTLDNQDVIRAPLAGEHIVCQFSADLECLFGAHE
ncbi:unnamed protein product [Protopolystoma xenopodis]|uniref:Uncharacterized protein n=1 Tax=Protopolystoma xenopodis TaxID=117903 RepID=A0A448WX15_9PLAT|nr:unnamed protein product [Protopolystoma xenopodis]